MSSLGRLIFEADFISSFLVSVPFPPVFSLLIFAYHFLVFWMTNDPLNWVTATPVEHILIVIKCNILYYNCEARLLILSDK